MGNITIWLLLILSAVLFIATQKKWIAQETLQTLANVAAVVALLAAILVFVIPTAQPQVVSNQTSTLTSTLENSPTPDFETPTAISSTPLSSEENWAIKFTHVFGSGFWDVGSYEYTLNIDCPDYTGSWTNTFEVSENAPTEPFLVYLRLSGLRDSEFGDTPIDKINPIQKTVAITTLTQMTKLTAENDYVSCKSNVEIEGISFELKAEPPFILEQ